MAYPKYQNCRALSQHENVSVTVLYTHAVVGYSFMQRIRVTRVPHRCAMDITWTPRVYGICVRSEISQNPHRTNNCGERALYDIIGACHLHYGYKYFTTHLPHTHGNGTFHDYDSPCGDHSNLKGLQDTPALPVR